MAHQSRLRRGRVSMPGQAYHIVTTTAARRPIFVSLPTARTVILEMKAMQDGEWLSSLAWVLMPDHLHWLFTLGTRASLSATMNRFKSASARSVNRIRTETTQVWHDGFYDHAVRRDEDLRTIARYIVANPLRKGLCTTVAHYPHWDAAWLP